MTPPQLPAVFAPPESRRRRRRLIWPARLVLFVLGAAAVTYVGICAYIYARQASLIYYPTRGYSATPTAFGLVYEPLTLLTADAVPIAAWYLPHLKAAGTVIYCHGNADRLSELINTFRQFHRLGYAVLAFDYRGFGESFGQPSEAGLYGDADAAWRWLTEIRGEPPERIVVIGRSLGGAVAAELARRRNPGALILECTFTSMVEMGRQQYPWLPVDLLCTHRFETIDKVDEITCPKLILHGADDTLVPVAHAQRLFAAAAGPKELIITPGDHNSAGLEYNAEVTARTAEWLKAALGE